MCPAAESAPVPPVPPGRAGPPGRNDAPNPSAPSNTALPEVADGLNPADPPPSGPSPGATTRAGAHTSSGDPAALVREFHQAFAVPIAADAPSVDRERVHLRMDLVAEEFAELVAAVYGPGAQEVIGAAFSQARGRDDGSRDTVAAADALGDLVYVIYGMALECGIPLPEVLAQIHASNMSKLGSDGKPVYRRDGKVLKAPGYTPPDVAGVLSRAVAEPR